MSDIKRQQNATLEKVKVRLLWH